jgi:hypothetical protein
MLLQLERSVERPVIGFRKQADQIDGRNTGDRAFPCARTRERQAGQEEKQQI